jgi:uncharacterized protein HemY
VSRFDSWTQKARAVLSSATAIDRAAPDLRERADELERQGLDEAATTLRAAATLLGRAKDELHAALKASQLTPATREVEYWRPS